MEDDYHDLIDRLSSLGRSAVPAEVSARTRNAMSGRLSRVRRWSRPAVAVAALAGFLFGSLGLAEAGALPGSVQDVAHDVLDHVGVAVPVGTERFNDPTVCPGGPYKNHGDYVKQHLDDPNAAQSDCGKPLVSVEHKQDQSTGSDDNSESTDSDESHGNENSSHSDNGNGSNGNDNSSNSSAADEHSQKDKEKNKGQGSSGDDSDESSSSSEGS